MTNLSNGALPPPPKQIRFVNNQGQPPSKRRRINAAYVFPSSYLFILALAGKPHYTAPARSRRWSSASPRLRCNCRGVCEGSRLFMLGSHSKKALDV